MKAEPLDNIILTKRQTEIVAKLAMGKTSKGIAKETNITESGVNKHIYDVGERLDAENRAHLVALAICKNIISVRGLILCLSMIGVVNTDNDFRNVRQHRVASSRMAKTSRNWEMRV